MSGEWSEQVPGQKSGEVTSDSVFKAIQQALKGAEEITGKSGQGGAPSFTPGSQAPAPAPNIMFSAQGAPGAPMQSARPTPSSGIPGTGSQSIGSFPSKQAETNAGLVSLGNSITGIFNEVGKKHQDKQAALAENYMTQISALLQSGDPADREKAKMFLEDPKIKKTLEKGLNYKPLEEEKAPPEAIGVQKALKKAAQGQGQKPQMSPVLPQASQGEQLKAAITNALLQKVRQDPSYALTLGGGSQLSSSDQKLAEFYKAGLGMSDAQLARMSTAEKLQGLKLYEGVLRESMKTQMEMYKIDTMNKSREEVAKIQAGGRITSSSILAKARTDVADAVRATNSKKGMAANYAAGAKVYSGLAKQYMDAASKPNVKPEDKARYEAQGKMYQQKADDYLTQSEDSDIINDFMNLVDEGDDAPE